MGSMIAIGKQSGQGIGDGPLGKVCNFMKYLIYSVLYKNQDPG
jgi:hypothetical protein